LNSSSNPVIYSTMKHIPVDVTDINKWVLVLFMITEISSKFKRN
jgi:hypothetical protein